MDYLRKAIYGPTPAEQLRACQQTLRRNRRQMERQMNEMAAIEKKTAALIRTAAKKGDKQAVRALAREMAHTRRASARVATSTAILGSIGLKLNEQQQLIKLKGSMQSSAQIMQDVATLVRLPEIGRVFSDLSKELTKSGVIDEMVQDVMDVDLEDDLEEEEDLDAIISQVLGDKAPLSVDARLQEVSSPQKEASPEPVAEDDDDDELLLNMRQRLSALQQ